MDRDVVVEFCGMPKSGKTTILNIVAQYMRRKGTVLNEFHGGGRYAPIGKGDLPTLNLYLAAEATRFLLPVGREGRTPRAHLLDRGILDRLIFTRALGSLNRLSVQHVAAVEGLLAEVAQLVDIGAVMVFTTDVESSLRRENINSLVGGQGRVMNNSLLGALRDAALAVIEEPPTWAPKTVIHVDTQARDGDPVQTAEFVLQCISHLLPQLGQSWPRN